MSLWRIWEKVKEIDTWSHLPFVCLVKGLPLFHHYLKWSNGPREVYTKDVLRSRLVYINDLNQWPCVTLLSRYCINVPILYQFSTSFNVCYLLRQSVSLTLIPNLHFLSYIEIYTKLYFSSVGSFLFLQWSTTDFFDEENSWFRSDPFLSPFPYKLTDISTKTYREEGEVTLVWLNQE